MWLSLFLTVKKAYSNRFTKLKKNIRYITRLPSRILYLNNDYRACTSNRKEYLGWFRKWRYRYVVPCISAGSLIPNDPFTIDSLSKNSLRQFSHSLLPWCNLQNPLDCKRLMNRIHEFFMSHFDGQIANDYP